MPGDENYLDSLLNSINGNEVEGKTNEPTSEAVMDRLRAFSKNSHDGFSVFSDPEPEVVTELIEEEPEEEIEVSQEGSVTESEQPVRLATDLTAEEIAAIFAPAEALAKEDNVASESVLEEPTIEPITEPITEPSIESIIEPTIEENIDLSAASILGTSETDDLSSLFSPDQISAMLDSIDIPTEEPAIEESAIEEPIIVEPIIEDPVIEEPALEEPVIEEQVVEEPAIEESVIEEPAPIEVTPVSDDPNAALTPEQIAAMFASVDVPAEEPVVEEPAIEEPVIEEQVVEEPAIEEPIIEEPAPIEVTPVSDDPNAALTPEQIAAMFASVDVPAEEPVVEEPAIEEPIIEESTPIEVTPVSDDPNAALTPEQIAAMFASVEAPAEEAVAEEPVVEESAPIEVTPVSDDPNAALTPEQIAAMFASVEAPAEEAVTEEPVVEESAPIEVTPVSDDPNAALTPEQIAAMFASVESPSEEPIAEEPVTEEPVIEEPAIEEPIIEESAPIEVTPVSDDPNAALTPEQIAAMFASVESPSEEPIAEEPVVEEPVIEEPVIEEPAIEEPIIEESTPIEVTPVSDDPNAALSPDEIAAMFASVGVTPEEAAPEENDYIDVQNEFAELLSNEEVVIDESNMDILEKLGERPSSNIDDFKPEEDFNLNEIEELLNMSDNHEKVEDTNDDIFDIFGSADGEVSTENMDIDALLESADTVHKRSGNALDLDADIQDDEVEDSGKKKKEKKQKVKKEKVKKEKKTKKSRRNQDQGEETEDEFQTDEIELDFEEAGKLLKNKKGGFFKKILDVLTEEEDDEEEEVNDPSIPERAAGEENLSILNELDAEDVIPEKGKKGKKGKKSKKEKEEDPKAKAKEEAAKAKKEAAQKAKKEKAEAAKEAKAKKAAEKAEKEAALGPIKKLPRKKVILIFCTFVPILAGLLTVGLIIPADNQRKEARSAYIEKDYNTVYENLYGQKLSEADQRIFDNSSAVLQMNRWIEAYHSYQDFGMPREALDALISGVNCYKNIIASRMDISDVSNTVRESYDTILFMLSSEYGVSEEYALQVAASKTDKEYTAYIDGILRGEPIAVPNTTEDIGSEIEPDSSEEQGDINSDIHGDNPPTNDELKDGNSTANGDGDSEYSNDDSAALIYEIYAQ